MRSVAITPPANAAAVFTQRRVSHTRQGGPSRFVHQPRGRLRVVGLPRSRGSAVLTASRPDGAPFAGASLWSSRQVRAQRLGSVVRTSEHERVPVEKKRRGPGRSGGRARRHRANGRRGARPALRRTRTRADRSSRKLSVERGAITVAAATGGDRLVDWALRY
jgi:hypothetical protein